MIVRDLLTRWKIIVDTKTLNKLDRQLRRTKKNFNEAGKAAIKFGKNMSLFVTLPLVTLGAALVKTASDAEEGASKFETVFKSLKKESQATAEQLKKDFGLSRAGAKELLADTGDLLTGFGFSQKSALDLSKQVQELAVDLASFTNFSGGAVGASKALTKALLGERESVKSLGISILEEDVKRQVALNTAKGMTFETQRQAKAFATLLLAQQQSQNAIGDFARTNKQFANRIRILGARANDLAVSFGQILIPPALALVNIITSLLEALDELSPTTKTIILSISALVAVLGPALIAFGLFLKLMVLVKGAILIAKIELVSFNATVILTFLALIAVVIATILVFDDLLAFFQGRKSVFGAMVLAVDEVLVKFQEAFPKMSILVLGFLSTILSPIQAVIGAVRGLSAVFGTLFGGGGISAALKAGGGEFVSAFSSFGKLSQGKKIGLQDLLGVSGIRQKALQSSTAGAQIQAGQKSGSTTNINVNSPITVPPGTPPELVGNKVKEGVMEVLGQQLRDTQQVVEPAAAF